MKVNTISFLNSFTLEMIIKSFDFVLNRQCQFINIECTKNPYI